MRTKRRAFIHAYMINYQRQHGRPPTLSTIAKHFGSGKTPVYYMLLSVAKNGIVRHDCGTEPSFTAIATPAVNSVAVNSVGSWTYEPQDAAGDEQ